MTNQTEPFSLAKTNYEIENIQFTKLQIDNDPGDIVWKSNDPSIADVIDNRLFALKEGTTTITGTSKDHSVTITVTVIHSITYNQPIHKASLKKLSNCYLTIYNDPNLPADAENQIENAVANVEKFTGLKFVSEKYDSLPYIILGPFGFVHPCGSVGLTCIDDWSLENKEIATSSIDPTIHELMHTLRMQNEVYGGTPYEEGVAMYNTWVIKNTYYGYNEPERRAGYIGQTQLVAELNRCRVAAVLAADTNVHFRTNSLTIPWTSGCPLTRPSASTTPPGGMSMAGTSTSPTAPTAVSTPPGNP